MRIKKTVVVGIGAATLIGGFAPAAGAASADGSSASNTARKGGVCKGIKHCYVMGRKDVTGDGRKDWIAAVNRHPNGIKNGKVTLRVKSKGKLRKKRLKVRTWKGNVFHGMARIDGRRGAEMVVGAKRKRYTQKTAAGRVRTHAKKFHVVSFRRGKLVRLKAPGQKTRRWHLTPRNGVRYGDATIPDAGYSKSLGYFRKKRNGKVRMTRKVFRCTGVAGCNARRKTFVWRKGRWIPKSASSIRRAKGGWHVRGLPTW